MKRLVLFLSIISVFAGVQPGFAQAAAEPVKWEYSYESLGNKEGYVIITAKMDKDWHIYSQFQTGDGPIPTSFVFTPDSDFEPLGKTTEPKADKAYSEVFGTDVISFEKEVIFKQKIRRKNLKAFDIKAELEFMACNNAMCLPPKTVKFSVKVPAEPGSK